MTLHELSASEAVEAIRARSLSVSEFLDSALARLEAVEPEVRAYAHVDSDLARARADAIDRRLESREEVGPLAGLVFGVKDIYDCAGLPTGNGVEAARATPAKRSAESVARVEAAGGIVLGKTVTTERAFLDPGSTRNPWDLGHTPGGSSSGSAAAVATRSVPLAFGSQTGGSVIRPAAYCGVLGMTFTHGLVSLHGVLPLAPPFDTFGMLARSLDDLALVGETLVEGRLRHGGAQVEGAETRASGPSFAFVLDWFLADVDAEAVTRARDDVDTIARGAPGASVESLGVPADLEEFWQHQRRIFASGAAGVHREAFERDPSSFAPKIAGLIEAGLKLSPAESAASAAHVDAFRVRFLERIAGFDALLLPSATGAAPRGLASTGSPVLNALWTALGLPSISIPSGLSRKGLPFGLQIIGKPFGEARLLVLARSCMEALGYGVPAPAI